MGKKLIGIALIAIMLFGAFGLMACDLGSNLANYKAIKSTEIQAYANEKGEENYCLIGWQAICKVVTDGKEAIEAAKSKSAVDMAVKDIKNAFDEVEEKKMAEITSIHFVITQSFKEQEYHKLYDFSKKTYSTKTVNTSVDHYEKEVQYEVVATFTEEQSQAFFKSIRELGIFDLEESYNDNDVFDGWDWKLVIALSDGKTFESGGYAKHPKQEEAIDEAFLSLTGYKLFSLS